MTDISKNKLRDIEISILWQSKKDTLLGIGKKYGLSKQRVFRIHEAYVKELLSKSGEFKGDYQCGKLYRCEQTLKRLVEYKQFLESSL